MTADTPNKITLALDYDVAQWLAQEAEKNKRSLEAQTLVMLRVAMSVWKAFPLEENNGSNS